MVQRRKQTYALYPSHWQHPSWQPRGHFVHAAISSLRPQNKQHKQPKNTTRAKRAKPAKHVARARADRGRSNARGRPRSGDASNAYTNCLKRPFFAPGVRLGFGTMVPTSARSMWKRFAPATITAQQGFLMVGTPSGNSAAAGGLGSQAAGVGFLSCVQTGSSTALFSSANVVNVAANNIASIGTYVNTSRVVSGAMRVTVRYPTSTARGQVFAGYVPDDFRFNLGNLSSDDLSSLPFMIPCSSTAAGEVTCEVQYRPSDLESYNFIGRWSTTGLYPFDISVPQLLVLGVGWPPIATGSASNWAIECNQIFHYECLAGLTAQGSDLSDDGPVTDALTLEQAAAASIHAGASVLTSQFLTESIDAFASNISSRGRFGTGRRGQAIGFQNTARLPVPTMGERALRTLPHELDSSVNVHPSLHPSPNPTQDAVQINRSDSSSSSQSRAPALATPASPSSKYAQLSQDDFVNMLEDGDADAADLSASTVLAVKKLVRNAFKN